MQTIGERLEEARKKKGISIREAAEATKIRGDYLQKFESNHFDIGLTEIYTRGFLRTYANFLKLPADRILNDYAALGRGDVRPRTPNREVYGRMDITVASTGAAESTAATEETPPAPEPSHANRGPQRPRTGSSLPTGPDPAVVFKYIKWGGIGLGVLLVLLFVWSLLTSDRKPSTTGNATPSAAVTPSTPATRGPSFGLVSTSPIQVRVHRANPDDTDGEQLFSGQLTPNQVQMVPWPGDVFIESTSAHLLFIEVNGKRYPMGLKAGEVRGRLPGPSR